MEDDRRIASSLYRSGELSNVECIFCEHPGQKSEIEFMGSKVTKELPICQSCSSQLKGLAYHVDTQADRREGFDEMFFSLVQVRRWWKGGE